MPPAEPPLLGRRPTTARTARHVQAPVHPSRAGFGWWRYERPPVPSPAARPAEPPAAPVTDDARDEAPDLTPTPRPNENLEAPKSPRGPLTLGAVLILVAVLLARAGVDGAGSYLLAAAGVSLAVA